MSDPDYITYEEFGRKFFEIAVTEERIADALASIAGEGFEMGPIAQGPGKIAKITAKVKIQTPVVTRDVGELLTFAIRIPLEIDMMIDLRIDKPQFIVFGEIALKATARAAAPLMLILDVEAPRSRDISIHVTSKSLRAEVVRVFGSVDAEIRRFIAAHVAGEINSPGSSKAKMIDIGGQIASAWQGV